MAFGLPGGRGPNLATEFALPNPGSVPQPNVGPQGGLGPKYIVRPGPRPGLYYYDNDEWVPQPVVVVDEDAWVNAPAGKFPPYVAPVVADGDDWIRSIPVDEDYWLINRHAPFVFGQPFNSDDDVSPFATLAVGDDGGQVWTSSPDINVPQVFLDDDLWVPSIKVDEDLPWIPQQSRVFAYVAPVTSDDDSLPTTVQPFGIDEDLWLINTFRPYVTPLRAYVADGDDWIPSIGVDEDLPWTPKASPQWVLVPPITSDDDVWVTPGAAPPNLHRLVMDINTGRLGWMVSGAHAGTPILVVFLD